MHFSSVKLTGNPGASGWAQVHEFTPSEPEKESVRGTFFGVVATRGKSSEGVASVSAGRELLARLHEEYFGKLETTAFNAIRLAVENVTAEFSGAWGDVEIAAVCVLGDVVYSAASGGAQTAIIREGAFAKILTSFPEPRENEAKASSVSGYPKEGDFLIFGTKKFFEIVSPEEIKEALETKNLKAAAEILAPLIHSAGDSETVGATILYFQEGGEEVFAGKEEPDGIEEKRPPVKAPEILSKIKGVFSKLITALPERKIYVRPDSGDASPPDNKKVTLSVGAIILVLLVLSIVFGVRQKGVRELRGRYEERLTRAEHSYEEANSLVSLSPDRARELYLEARDLTNVLKSEGVKDKRLDELIEKLERTGGSILGEFKEEPELFLDLTLLTSGANGDDLAASGGNLFVLDKNTKRIVRIAIDTKNTETVAGPDQMTLPQGVAGYEDRAFVLEESGIFEVGSGRVEAVEDSWEGEVLTHVFAANFYVLEKGAGTIWRYPGGGELAESFGAKQNWFGAGVTPNLSGAISMAIDGAIWVLNEGGRILKFSQGSPQAFSPQGITLTAVTAIYTDEENSYLYVLDRASKKVIVLEKDGKYKAQYVNDKIGEATDLAVSEAEGKVILLAGPKLYSLAIRH